MGAYKEKMKEIKEKQLNGTDSSNDQKEFSSKPLIDESKQNIDNVESKLKNSSVKELIDKYESGKNNIETTIAVENIDNAQITNASKEINSTITSSKDAINFLKSITISNDLSTIATLKEEMKKVSRSSMDNGEVYKILCEVVCDVIKI